MDENKTPGIHTFCLPIYLIVVILSKSFFEIKLVNQSVFVDKPNTAYKGFNMKRKELHGRKTKNVALTSNEDLHQLGKLHSVNRIVVLHSMDQTWWKHRLI